MYCCCRHWVVAVVCTLCDVDAVCRELEDLEQQEKLQEVAVIKAKVHCIFSVL